MIHCENVEEIYSGRNMTLWLMSAFKAGFINAGGFLITGKFVSHVTGFGTQMGMAIGHHEILFGIELTVIPLAFICGSALTSLILDRSFSRGELPHYHFVQFLITALIGLIIFLGGREFWGPFGNQSESQVNIVMIGLLCLICGLKNSLVTWATMGKIRVTHLTGLSTDIGLHLPEMFGVNKSRFKESRFVNYHRIATFLSFSGGSLISALAFPKVGYNGFFIVLVISSVMTLVSFLDYGKRLSSHSR